MKWIRKVGSIALSAAMAAGMGTTVFAANEGDTSKPADTETDADNGETYVTIADSAGKIVATTRNRNEIKDVYLEDDKTTQPGDSENREVFNVDLVPGDVKALYGYTSDSNGVKWAYAASTDDVNSDSNVMTAAKKFIKIDDGKITVSDDLLKSKNSASFDELKNQVITFYGYVGSSKAAGNSVAQPDDGEYVEVNVTVHEFKNMEVAFETADTVFTSADEGEIINALSPTDGSKGSISDLPEVDHKAEEFTSDPTYIVSHVGYGESVNVKGVLYYDAGDTTGANVGEAVKDYADYNTAVSVSAEPDTMLKAKMTDETNNAVVTSVGAADKTTGFGTVTMSYGEKALKKNAAKSNAVYVVGDTGIAMYRMYNPNSGEHFYTADKKERDTIEAAGWTYEGIGWYAPKTSTKPVYRLYNPNAGEHHYTLDAHEKEVLIKAGWKDEGIGWYSATNYNVPVYRQYNPNAAANNHNFTTNKVEMKLIVAMGWHDEGIGWYAVAAGDQDTNNRNA